MKQGVEMTIENNMTVAVHYETKDEQGEIIDSSYTRGQPISFTVGSGNVIPGFDKAVIGLSEGDRKTFEVNPEDAYGPIVEDAVRTFPKTQFPEGFVFDVGTQVQAQMENGNNVLARITEVKEEEVQVDFNHPYAGQTLSFNIEIVEVHREQTTEA